MLKNSIFKKIFGVVTAVAVMSAALLPSAVLAAPKIYNEISRFAAPSLMNTADTITITKADELVAALGNGGDGADTAGKTYILAPENGDSLDMTGKTFVPVKEFKGTFNGNNKTIENLNIRTESTTNVPAAFVQTLAHDSTIYDVTFLNCTYIGNSQAAGVASVSYGIINNVFVNNAKIKMTATGGNLQAGGLVGQYYKKRTENGITQIADGKITNCLFSGSISLTTTGTESIEIPSGSQGSVGGVIGKVNGTLDENDVSKVYWDMSTTPGITKIIGTGTAPGEVIGISVLASKDIIHESTVAFSELISFTPRPITTGNWTVEAVTPADSVQKTDAGYYGNGVGKGTAVYTLTVGGNTLTMQCNITVLAKGRDALKLAIEEAEKNYPTANAGDYNKTPDGKNDTAWNLYIAALNAAKGVLGNTSATSAQVEKAIDDLNAAINDLIKIDRDNLALRLTELEDYTREADYYDTNTFAAFMSAYNNGVTVKDEVSSKSTELRTAKTSLNNAFDGLKLLLGNTAIERNADNTQATITINGYKKPGVSISNTGVTAVVTGASSISNESHVSANVMTITMTKQAMTDALYNKGGTLKVVISDNRKQSAEATVTLNARPNYVTGDVDDIDLGVIALGQTVTDTKISGIPLTYNPTTGAEENYKATGNVLKWELDDTLNENPSWATVGKKYLVGTIADSANPVYTNADTHVAKAVVEVVDKTALNTLIAEANTYSEANYTQETWIPFKLALDSARTVNSSKESTQEQINKALGDLQTAMDALKTQPKIVLTNSKVSIRRNSIFEPLTYVKSVTNVGEDEEELVNKVLVKTGDTILWQEGKQVTALNTSSPTVYEVEYSVTNTQGVSATANLTVTVLSTTDPTSSGSSSSSSSNGGGGGDSNIVSGDNTITNGDVTVEFKGTDVLTQEEIDAGAKVILQVNAVTDETNIRAVLEKIAKLLKGEVTIDGIYDISLYKEINGNRTKISNSDIKGNISIYLPISQAAIDSGDSAVIHVLENNGYELFKGAVTEKDGKKVVKITIKAFSEFAVVYGGGVSNAADSLDTTGTTASTAATASTASTAAGGGTATTGAAGVNTTAAPGQDGQGGADGGSAESTDTTQASGNLLKAAATGDKYPLIAVLATALFAAGIMVIITLKKKHNKSK